MPDTLKEWARTEISERQPGRGKSLVLISPSRFGKTEWARSLGRHMYFNNAVNFRDDWDDDSKYIIFDDIEWDFIPNKKGFFGQQSTITINGKYMRTKTIDWGKPAICLTNKYPPYGADADWFHDNVLTYHLDNKLF